MALESTDLVWIIRFHIVSSRGGEGGGAAAVAAVFPVTRRNPHSQLWVSDSLSVPFFTK